MKFFLEFSKNFDIYFLKSMSGNMGIHTDFQKNIFWSICISAQISFLRFYVISGTDKSFFWGSHSILHTYHYLSENLYLIGGAILHGKLTPQGTVQFNLVLGNRDRWESRIRSLESMHKSWKSLFKLSKLDKQINRAILKNCIKFCNTVSVHHCLFWFSHQHWSQG